MWRPSVSVLKRRFGIDEDEDNEEVEEEARRRMRTPSPVREDVAELRGKIQDIKSTFGAIGTHSKSIIPTALKNILQKHEFADAEEILNIAETPKSKAEADAFVALVGGRFVESIAMSSNGSWAFITQVEAYLRGRKEIDDCANNTITSEHPSKPKFVVEHKREYENQWLEAKIYFKNFEFLVTACLCGNYNDHDFDAFLGASLGNRLALNDYWRVYVPLASTPVARQSRLLRNFTKRASGFDWHLKSQRFYDNGFSTACALSLHALDGIDSIVAIGSLLLNWKVSNQEDKQKLKSILFNVKELSNMDENAISGCIERVRGSTLAKGKKLAVEIALLILKNEVIKDTDYVEMFKALISSRLKTLNSQAIRQKRYLLP